MSAPTTTTPVATLAPATETPKGKYSLSETAMTVGLHLSMWNGRRLDRETTQEILTEREAERDAGRFEKNLVPPTELQPVTKAHGRARAAHYALTLPWGDEAVRILPAAMFFPYTERMNEERSNCERAHREFCERYPRLLDAAPVRLGRRLFQEADFPKPSAIADRFGFRLVILPVPESGDFRVRLGQEAEAEIRASIEETVLERYAEAQRDLWERLLDTIRHFARTMATEDKIFKNSTVTKLTDLAKIAPKLSLKPDPKVDEICAEIVRLTTRVDPDDLRNDPKARKTAAKDARATLAKIEAAMAGAF